MCDKQCPIAHRALLDETWEGVAWPGKSHPSVPVTSFFLQEGDTHRTFYYTRRETTEQEQ